MLWYAIERTFDAVDPLEGLSQPRFYSPLVIKDNGRGGPGRKRCRRSRQKLQRHWHRADATGPVLDAIGGWNWDGVPSSVFSVVVVAT